MMMKKLVCMGDSLTEGYGVSVESRWTDLLSLKLDIPIINSGISGDTTNGMLSRFREMVIDLNPSHVFILGGTNDVYLRVPDEVILSNLLAMMRYARYKGLEVIMGIPTPIYEGDLDESIIYLNPIPAALAIEQFNKKLIQFCIEEEIAYVNFYQGFNKDMMLTDGLHPNETGHSWMVKRIIDKI